jgi:hypothetical protein
MNLTFVETSNFTAMVREYFVTDENYLRFQLAVMADPQRGAVMPGCGGLRKTRWADPRRGKGARGGIRVIYLHVPEADHVLLVDMYDKDEADDLTPDEKRVWAEFARRYREQVVRRKEAR